VLTPMVELQNVSKSFSNRGVVIKDINFQVEKGEMVCLFSPNGTGKTTILFICAGLETFDSGEVLIEGRRISSMSETEKGLMRNQKIGIVFQIYQLIPYFTAFENVMVPFYVRGTPVKEARSQVEETLIQIGIRHIASKKPSQLSGGEQQLVGIARAVAYQPEILLVDEPTAHLDQDNKKLVWSVLEGLHRRGKTIILASHDQEIRGACRRIWNPRN